MPVTIEDQKLVTDAIVLERAVRVLERRLAQGPSGGGWHWRVVAGDLEIMARRLRRAAGESGPGVEGP